MSDTRDWNQDFNESRENYKRMKIKDDMKLIEKYASDIEKQKNENGKEKWIISFHTKYGLSKVIYFTDSGKWHKEIGAAKGKGAVNMLNYFKPISREANGNNS